MNCAKIRNIIPRYVEHSATEEEISMVEEHLCVCHECRQYLSNFLNKDDAGSPESDSYVKNKNVKKKIDVFTILVLGISIAVVLISLWLFF